MIELDDINRREGLVKSDPLPQVFKSDSFYLRV